MSAPVQGTRAKVNQDLAQAGDHPCTNAEVAAYPLDLSSPCVRLLRTFVTLIGDVPANCQLVPDPRNPRQKIWQKKAVVAAQGKPA